MEKDITMKEKISIELESAIRGSGKVKITFKKEAVDALDKFCKMERKGAVYMSDSCAAILSAAKQKRYWGHPANRITIVVLGVNFNEDEFIKEMTEAIENIEAVK